MIKNFLAFILIFSTLAQSWAGLPPTTLKGQSGTKRTTFNFEVPNELSTATSTGTLIELNNDNILANPSFEHSNFSTGWTNSGTCSGSVETTIVIHGKKSYGFSCTAQTLNLTNDSTNYATQFASVVPGIASVRIQSTSTSVFACSRQAGTTNLSNCAQLSGASQWELKRIPYQLGATSNGIAIVSGTISSGTVTLGNITATGQIDNAWVGMTQDFDQYPALPKTSTFTPTGAWNTNTTYAGKYRQEGNWFEFQYSISLSGAPNAANLVLNLPTGFVIDTNELSSSQSFSGVGGGDGVSGGNSVKFSVVYTSTTTVTVLAQQGLAANNHVQSFVSATAPYTFTSGDYLKLNFKVPIVGYSAAVNTYSDQCASDPACENVFTASVSSTGVVSGENLDWLAGDFVVTSTNVFTASVNYSSLGLTTGMGCNMSGNAAGGSQRTYDMASSSTSQVVVNTYNGSSAAAVPFNITCTKRSPDFKARRQIVGTFANTPKIRGITTPTTYLVAFGGATVNTACTASPCTVHHNPSGIALTATRVSIGQFRVNFPNGTFTPNSYVYCFRNTISTQGESAGVVVADANGAAIYTINTRDAVGALQDSAAAVSCTGQ